LRLKIRAFLLASSSTTIASVAITSTPSNNWRRHLLPRRSSAPATAMEAFSAGPPGDGDWLCILPCTSAIGNTGACPSSPTHSRAWQTWACVADGLTASTSASAPLRLPRHVAIFISGVFSIAPPPWRLLVRPRLHVRLPRLRQPRQLYLDHGYPMHDIFNHGSLPSSSATSTLAQRATIRMSYSPVFSPVAASAPHRCYDCGVMLVRWLLLPASSPVSPFAVLPL